jgi:biopolymer transport protein ExbD
MLGLGAPEVSTASLPDIVFILLFFFMTVTVMKDIPLRVDNELPIATEVKKLEKKDRVIYVHIGRPNGSYPKSWGTEPRIQLNDKYAKISEVGPYVIGHISKIPVESRHVVMVALKVDKKVSMGLISDVKEELRKVNVLKINYTTYAGESTETIP